MSKPSGSPVGRFCKVMFWILVPIFLIVPTLRAVVVFLVNVVLGLGSGLIILAFVLGVITVVVATPVLLARYIADGQVFKR